MTPSKRDLSRRLDKLEDERGATDGFEIVLREEVIRTPWSDDKDDPPEPGTTTTRYFYDENGNWQSEVLDDE